MSFVIPLIEAGIELGPEIYEAGKTAYQGYQIAKTAYDVGKGVSDTLKPSEPATDTEKPQRGLNLGSMLDIGSKLTPLLEPAKNMYDIVSGLGLIDDKPDEQVKPPTQVEEDKKVTVGPNRQALPTEIQISQNQNLGSSLTPEQQQNLLLHNQYTPVTCSAGASEKVGDSLGPLPPKLYGYNVSLLSNPSNAIRNNSLYGGGFGNRAMMYSMRGGNNQSTYNKYNNALSVTKTPHNPPDATNPVGLETLNQKSRLTTNRGRSVSEASGYNVGRVQYKQDQRLINNDINTLTAGYPFKMSRGISL